MGAQRCGKDPCSNSYPPPLGRRGTSTVASVRVGAPWVMRHRKARQMSSSTSSASTPSSCQQPSFTISFLVCRHAAEWQPHKDAADAVKIVRETKQAQRQEEEKEPTQKAGDGLKQSTLLVGIEAAKQWQQRAEQALVAWMATCKVPFNKVNSAGFQHFTKILNTRFERLTRYRYEQVVVALAEQIRKKVRPLRCFPLILVLTLALPALPYLCPLDSRSHRSGGSDIRSDGRLDFSCRSCTTSCRASPAFTLALLFWTFWFFTARHCVLPCPFLCAFCCCLFPSFFLVRFALLLFIWLSCHPLLS